MNFEQFKKKLNSFLSASKILNNLPDMVLYLNSDGIILEANDSAKNNLGITENITINDLFSEGYSAIRQSAKSGKFVLIESKSKEYFELTASKIDNNYCVCIRDNTKVIRDNIEQEGIEKFNNEKNAFIANLEEEIVSPLNTITGFSQGLVDGIGGEVTQKQSKYLKIIQSNANELSEFMSKFLNFSHVESLAYKPELKTFDIVLEMKNIIKEYDKKYGSEKFNIDFYYDGFENRNVYSDFKAVDMLLKNIIETCFESKNIEIFVSQPNDESFITYGLDEGRKYAQIKIKTSNVVILQNEIKNICNPYANVDKGKKQLLRSLRLGIASILVKRINGFFNISCDNGNLFSIIIPVQKDEDE